MEPVRTKAVAESKPQGKELQGILTSVALHLGIAGFMVFSTVAAQPEPPQEEGVLVEVLSSEEYKAVLEEIAKEAAKDKQEPASEQEKPEPSEKETPKTEPKPKAEDQPQASAPVIGVHPLPRARKVKEERKALSEDQQREKTCHAEAIAQITKARSDLQPDLIISAAVDQFIASGNTLLSNGAAFRSKGRWYNFKFKCETSADLKTIVAFQFLIGEAFPQEELETRKPVPIIRTQQTKP
ncbi:MAG: hypothetical protein COA52_18305 [Hyphomicrobiales bacterium]|nr:MAG: hypothetical protein COA52_18305 [Hyphomicrobiales bacterium]